MKIRSAHFKLLSLIIISILMTLAPISLASASQISWNNYEAMAQSYGCILNLQEKDRAKLMKTMSLDEFENALIEQKELVDSELTANTIECTTTNDRSLEPFSSKYLLTTTTGTATNVWVGSGSIALGIGLNTYIKATYYTSTNTFKSCDSVSSYIYGLTIGHSWNQTSYSSSFNSSKKILNVTVHGLLNSFVVTDIAGNIFSWPRTLYYSCTLA